MIPYLYPHRTTTHPPTYNTHNPPTYQNPPTPTTPRLLHCTPGASAPPASTSPRSGAATPSRPSAPTATLLTTRACPSPTGASTGRGACQNACSRAACCLCFFFFRLYIFLDLKNDRLVVARWIQSPLSISPPPSCCGYLVVSVMLQRTEDTYLPACLILPPSLPPSLPSTPRRRRQRTDPPNPLFLPPTHDDRRQCILRTERRPRGCRYTLDQPLGPLPHPPLDDQARPRKGLLRGVFDWPG